MLILGIMNTVSEAVAESLDDDVLPASKLVIRVIELATLGICIMFVAGGVP
jgi:hypothetical protein